MDSSDTSSTWMLGTPVMLMVGMVPKSAEPLSSPPSFGGTGRGSLSSGLMLICGIAKDVGRAVAVFTTLAAVEWFGFV